MSRPLSRSYGVFLENPEHPASAAGRAAVAVAGTQAFYDWHEVNRLAPDYNYQRLIPDGQLASAGRAKYAGLDLVRTDWPATRVNRGTYHMVFTAATIHNPSFFKAYITRAGWGPTLPLRWADLEVLDGAQNARQEGGTYVFDSVLPARTGKHVIYVIWQRIDPAGEVFFSTSDVDFGDGTGVGNPSDGTSGGGSTPGGGGTTPGGGGTNPSGPQLAAVEFREDSRWNTGFTGTLRVTNKGTNLIDGWTLAFQLNGTISTSWSAVSRGKSGNTYTFVNETWNGRIAPGATVSFGFQAAAGAGVKPTGFLLNGKAPDPVCGTPTPPVPTTPVAAQLSLKVSRNWGTGFTADAALKNLSSRDLNGWTTTFDFPHRITTLWNAELVSRSGNRYTIKNASWNAPLKAGATVSFGFNADPGGVIQPPTNVTLK